MISASQEAIITPNGWFKVLPSCAAFVLHTPCTARSVKAHGPLQRRAFIADTQYPDHPVIGCRGPDSSASFVSLLISWLAGLLSFETKVLSNVERSFKKIT